MSEIFCGVAECGRVPAGTDRICGNHQGRFLHLLGALPELLPHLREQRMPGSGPGDRVSGTREAPAPISLAAVDDADALLVTLASTAAVLSELIGVSWDPPVGWRTDGALAGWSSSTSIESPMKWIRFTSTWFAKLVEDEAAGETVATSSRPSDRSWRAGL